MVQAAASSAAAGRGSWSSAARSASGPASRSGASVRGQPARSSSVSPTISMMRSKRAGSSIGCSPRLTTTLDRAAMSAAVSASQIGVRASSVGVGALAAAQPRVRHELELLEGPQQRVEPAQALGLARSPRPATRGGMPCAAAGSSSPAGRRRRCGIRAAPREASGSRVHGASGAAALGLRQHVVGQQPHRPAGGALCAPERHAVPAMSRWAQRSLSVKRCRNIAAVMAPPARAPTLAMSAKLLFKRLVVFVVERHAPARVERSVAAREQRARPARRAA